MRRFISENRYSGQGNRLDQADPYWRATVERHMDAVEVALLLMPQAEEVCTRVVQALRLSVRALHEALRADDGTAFELLHLDGGANGSVQRCSASQPPRTWRDQPRGVSPLGMMIGVGELWNAITSDFGTGLMGALVGGSLSLLGVRMQSKAADKSARETLAKSSAMSAYEVLGALQELTASMEFTDSQDQDRLTVAQWNGERSILVMRAKGAANLLPKSQERRRTTIRKALSLIQDWDVEIPWSDYRSGVQLLVSEAREQLGTFVQDEPEPTRVDIAAEFTAHVERCQRRRLIMRLYSLEAEAEYQGLDDESQVEADGIAQRLGVRKSSDLPPDDQIPSLS